MCKLNQVYKIGRSFFDFFSPPILLDDVWQIFAIFVDQIKSNYEMNIDIHVIWGRFCKKPSM